MANENEKERYYKSVDVDASGQQRELGSTTPKLTLADAMAIVSYYMNMALVMCEGLRDKAAARHEAVKAEVYDGLGSALKVLKDMRVYDIFTKAQVDAFVPETVRSNQLESAKIGTLRDPTEIVDPQDSADINTLRQAYLTLHTRYYELINAVAVKYAGESRHQTALRYILERETRCPEADKESEV